MAGVQCQGQGMDTGTKGYRAYFQSVCVCVCVCVCVYVCVVLCGCIPCLGLSNHQHNSVKLQNCPEQTNNDTTIDQELVTHSLQDKSSLAACFYK
jgi:hypothetical protein